jgi:carbamoylphosphate synthase large subunit
VVDKYNDKKIVNDLLRPVGGFTVPRRFTASSPNEVAKFAGGISYPVVAKAIRVAVTVSASRYVTTKASF